jgi:Zn-finger nucleic acid-binding protein
VDPYRTPGAVVGPPCPRCAGVALTRRPLADASVDECARCRGVFVAPKVVERISRDLSLRAAISDTFAGGPVVEPLGVNALRCPRCSIGMRRQELARDAKVWIDVCGAHGTWFDARELPAMVALVGQKRQERKQKKPKPEESETVTDLSDGYGTSVLGTIAEILFWWAV